MTSKNDKPQKKSIRDIPIPTRAEKQLLNQKLEQVEDKVLHELIVTAEDIETVEHHKQIKHTKTEEQEHEEQHVKKKTTRRVHKIDDIKTAHSNSHAHRGHTTHMPISDSTTEIKSAFETIEESEETYENWDKKKKKGYVFWLLCCGIAIFLFFGIAYGFNSATVTLTPKKYEVRIDTAKIYISDVGHKQIDIESDQSVTLTAQGLMQVDRKATGTVVLYNNFSSSPQKLVANTRLETSTGKIFRLNNAVTIPGLTKNGSKTTPGSVSAQVTADQSGSGYNVGYQDFKIAAYKGTARYDKMYARSKTSIDGGYSGKVPNISQNTINNETNTLKEKLLADIVAQAKKSESADYVFLPDAFVVSFSEATQDVSNDGKEVTVTIHADAVAMLLSKNDLSKMILKNENLIRTSTSTAELQQQITYTGDLDAIKIKFPEDTNSGDLKDNKNIYFIVSGTTSIYSSIDQATVAMAVSTLPVEQAVPVLQELTDSPDVQVSIWPFWSSVLPTKDKIKLKIN